MANETRLTAAIRLICKMRMRVETKLRADINMNREEDRHGQHARCFAVTITS
ncbi:MAG: hypothetical protein JNM02_14575 [Anaerolineales bacterium]|nr:hypothetical protein [Anaerolineales bacterium]